MITIEQYEEALKAKDAAFKVITEYGKQLSVQFEQRMRDNPIFTDDELIYSARTLCECGHGLAYPKKCGAFHYWDCSAILKGIANIDVVHTDRLPFTTYDIKSESERNGTTRDVFMPK